MKIQRLFLRNVRSIKSLDLDFRDPVTGKSMSRIVLAGANGSGKTTILDTLFHLVGALGSTKEVEAEKRLWLVERSEAQAQAVIEFKVSQNRTKYLSVVAGGRPIVEETELAYWPKENEAWSWAAKLTARRDPGGNIVYFPHSRELPPVVLEQLAAEEVVLQWSYKYVSPDQWEGSVESFLVWQNYLDLEDRDKGKQADRFKRLVAPVNSILMDKRIVEVERGRVVVQTGTGQRHGLDDLSSGEKQLVLLLIEITRRIVPGSVILIDEPEISLHPTWQRGLVAALDKIIEQYDAQVIMATHSPEIVRMAFPEERIILTDLDMPRGEWKPELEVAA